MSSRQEESLKEIFFATDAATDGTKYEPSLVFNLLRLARMPINTKLAISFSHEWLKDNDIDRDMYESNIKELETERLITKITGSQTRGWSRILFTQKGYALFNTILLTKLSSRIKIPKNREILKVQPTFAITINQTELNKGLDMIKKIRKIHEPKQASSQQGFVNELTHLVNNQINLFIEEDNQTEEVKKLNQKNIDKRLASSTTRRNLTFSKMNTEKNQDVVIWKNEPKLTQKDLVQLTFIANFVSQDGTLPAPIFYRSWKYEHGKKVGGRIYHAYQKLGGIRRSILIFDGEEVAELDFVSMSLRTFYNYLGLEAPKDCYILSCPLYDKYDPDKGREAMKKLAQLIMNWSCKADSIFGNCAGYLKKEHGLSTEDCWKTINLFLEFHKNIAHLFGEAWILGQRLDSSICKKILTACSKDNIPVLSWHDSIVMRVSDCPTVYNLMVDSYKDTLGFTPEISRE